MTRLFLLLAAMITIVACEKDGDKIYLFSQGEGNLMVTENKVVLTQEVSKQIVLSLAWIRNELSVSDPATNAPNVLSTTLQVSSQSDFADHVTESLETATSKAYTGADLNTVAKNLGATPGEATTLYFRIKSTTGNNMEPAYSKVAEVAVTPYLIDMSVGFILDSKEEDTGFTLYSPTSNGEYMGFMGATGWSNYYLKEGDGTVWGNDGVDGTPFLISSEDTKWNFWFPGISGCYYVDVNTNKKVWSALLISALNVSGDITAEMTFDRPNVKWTATFTATQAGNLTIRISGAGKQYDYSTGTEDTSAIDTPVGFTANGTGITFGGQPGDLSINVPAAGAYTLVLDLSDPKAWTCQAVSGSTVPTEVNKEIYLSGVDDGISGSWTFDNFLTLYNENELAYAGVVNVNSLWGYGIYTEKDNWEDFYKQGTGDALQGTLIAKSETNLPAPEAGVYLFDISLKGLSYALTKVGNEIYYSGLNDDWSGFSPLVLKTGSTATYTGDITISKASEWGFKLYLENGNWDVVFGGSNGTLYFKGDGITDDADLSPGTYTLTVNLIKGTYEIVTK